MIALAYVGLAWFFGVMVADILPPPETPKEDARGRYATCRPWCAMSGSFKNGVVRTLAPWPFRRGKFYECPRHGDKDHCSGETFLYGRWMPPDVVLVGSTAAGKDLHECRSGQQDLLRRLDSAQRCCGREIPEDKIINGCIGLDCGWDGTIIDGSVIETEKIDTTKLQ